MRTTKKQIARQVADRLNARAVKVYGDRLTVDRKGQVMNAQGVYFLDLEPHEFKDKTDEELVGHLETLLWYDYQDARE